MESLIYCLLSPKNRIKKYICFQIRLDTCANRRMLWVYAANFLMNVESRRCLGRQRVGSYQWLVYTKQLCDYHCRLYEFCERHNSNLLLSSVTFGLSRLEIKTNSAF